MPNKSDSSTSKGRKWLVLPVLPLVWMLGACATPSPIRTESGVDLDRFMGDWYVIAHIPARIELNAYNAVESYRLMEDGTIATTYTFNEGAFDGEPRRYDPKGFPDASTGNGVWGMQFLWPFKAEYRIVYVDDDYEVTIIGRSKRDYVWIMARTPSLPDSTLTEMRELLTDEGYDLSALRIVPQQW